MDLFYCRENKEISKDKNLEGKKGGMKEKERRGEKGGGKLDLVKTQSIDHIVINTQEEDLEL